MKRIATIILVFTSCYIELAAQGFLNQNASNILDQTIVFHNPAGMAYSRGMQGLVGMQWFYAGISDNTLRNTSAFFVYPLRENDAVGVRAFRFTSNLLQEGKVSLLFGHKFIDDRWSLGCNANILYFAYDQGKFQDFDFADPVIANGTTKCAISIGASALLWLSERLAWGLSIDDINQPNIALGQSRFKEDIVYKLGAVYLHPLLTPQLDVRMGGGEVALQVGARRSFLDNKVDLFAGYRGAGSNGSALFFEISIIPGVWGLSYNFRHELSEIGQVTNGSHFLTLRFSKSGHAAAFSKPIVKLDNPDTVVVNITHLIVSGEARSSNGITLVKYLRNGEVVHTQSYEQKLKRAPLWFGMPLDEDANEIEVVAYAGKRKSSKTIHVTFDPKVLPPRISFFSSVVAVVDTPFYHLHARIDDSRGLQRLRVLVNGEERKIVAFTERDSSREINEPISLFEGPNVIEVIAANDKKEGTKAARITYHPKGVAIAAPEIIIVSPEELKTQLRMQTPRSLVRLEWQVKNVENLADVNLKANDSLLTLSTNELISSGETRFVFRKDINLCEGHNRIEVHAHRSGHHLSKEIQVFYNPLLGKRLYRKTWGILIGINDYQDPSMQDLEMPVNDAKGMERLLSEQFKIDHFIRLYGHEATRDRVIAALSDSLRDMEFDDGVFVFFAGHGYTEMTPEGPLGYIVPYDGIWESYTANISMEQMRETSRIPKAKHIFYVIDACYSGLLLARRGETKTTATDINFRRILDKVSKRSRDVLTAGGQGEKVLDGGFENHSIFTGRLLQGLRGAADLNGDSYVTAGEISKYVTDTVSRDAKMRRAAQSPQFGKLTADDGEFVFVRKSQ